MRPSLSNVLLFLVLTFLAQSLIVDAKKCKNVESDKKGKGRKCGKKENRKSRVGRSKDRVSKKKSAAPYWRRGPPDGLQTVRIGDKVTLTCAIKGNPAPKFTWLLNGKKLSPTNANNITVRRHRLTIRKVVLEDYGKYICVAKNDLGSLNFTFSLSILENIRDADLEIAHRPENKTAHVGDTVLFTCRSMDYPPPDVRWTRQTEGSRIMEDVTYSTRVNDHTVLVLPNVTKADSGLYRCFIGYAGMHREFPATLTVIEEYESLPYEPPCGLHVRKQFLVDPRHGCRSSKPMEINYCMGSCGRSYSTVEMDLDLGFYFNQTCKCCVGIWESMRLAELDCFLGVKKEFFYPLFTGCQCKSCHAEGNHKSSTSAPTPSPKLGLP